MTREEHVTALFTGANPAPDLDRLTLADDDRDHLDTVDQWSHGLSDSMVRRIDPAVSGLRRLASGGMAAAAVTVAGFVTMIVVLNSMDDVASPPEVAAVEMAIAAYNEGDVEGWVAAWDPEAEEVERAPWGYFFEILMNANEQMTIVEPCRLADETEGTVECTISYRDDFHGPAGVNLDTTLTRFTLNDERIITAWDTGRVVANEEMAYTRSFNVWLRDNHADVYEDIRPIDIEALPGFRTDPTDMAIAILYVEEFVAASDVWPLSSDE